MLSYFLEWSHSLFNTVYLEIEKSNEKNKKNTTNMKPKKSECVKVAILDRPMNAREKA